MTGKQDALDDVVALIRNNGLTLEEISAALQGRGETKEQKSGNILMRVFGYLGGLFVFAGLSTFVGMQWATMGAPMHIMATLGIGFCVFVMALTCANNEKLTHAATPLFLIAALLEPVGIGVTMMEFSRGGDPAQGLLFMLLVMTVQQGCAFWALDRTVLALTTLFFGGSLFTVAADLMHTPPDLTCFTVGISLMCIGWSIDKSKHKALAWVCYLFGSASVLCIAEDLLHNTPFEILFLGLSCGVIFLSTVVRSKTLLVVGTFGTLGFIGYYMDEHFGNTLAGPIGLVIVGVLLIGAGVLAVKINNKYIKQKG